MKKTRVLKKIEHNKKNKDLVAPYDGTSEIIAESTLCRDESGKLVFWYITNFFEKINLTKYFRAVKYGKQPRNSGLITTDKVFGFSGRDAIRNFPARITSLHSSQPEVGKFFLALASIIDKKMQELPEYKQQQETVQKEIPLDYIIPNSIFTSGVINKNNQLSYHYDSGNLKDTISALITCRSGSESGGIIHIPDYGIYLKNLNKSILFFNNKETLHAVTPIDKNEERYTAAYYTMANLRGCGTYEDEIKMINQNQMKKFTK